MGFRAMMEHSAERETTPTLWIIIPFITVIGIAFYRLNKGLDHNFGVEFSAGSAFSLLIGPVLDTAGLWLAWLHGDAAVRLFRAFRLR
jgi:hypothetical protein